MRSIFFAVFLSFLSSVLVAQQRTVYQIVEDNLTENPGYALTLLDELDTIEVAKTDSSFAYYFLKGKALVQKKSMDEARESLSRAWSIVRESLRYETIDKVLNQLGHLENATGNHDQSFKYFTIQVVNARAHYTEGLVNALNNLGIANYFLGAKMKALAVFLEAKEEARRTNHPRLANQYRNVAAMYFEIDQNRADSSLYYMKPALALYTDDQRNERAAVLALIGRYFMALGHYDSAYYYLNKGVQEAILSGEVEAYTTTQAQLSVYYRETGKYEQALNLMREAYRSFKEQHFYDGLVFVGKNISAVYKELGNADSAVYYLAQAQEARDSLFNQQRASSIAEFEVKYGTLEKERLLTETQLKVANQRVRLLVIGFGSFGLIVVLVIWMIASRNRQRRQLSELKLQEQDRAIKAVITAQEEERRRIARELHDGVGQSMSAILMHQKSIENLKLPGKVKLAVEQSTDLIESTRKEIREISHQMMPSALIEVGLAEAIRQMLETSLGLYGIDYNYDSMIDDYDRFEEHIEVGLYRISQELIQNIIKHAHPRMVSISLYRRSGFPHLLVEDDGEGFDMSKTNHGMGLSNLKTRLEMIRGDLNMDSNQGKGTIAMIKVPVA